MPRTLILCLTGFSLVASAAHASDLVADNAEVRRLADGFAFTEGPAADKQGNVYFTDIPNNRIHKWSLDGKLTVFRENSGGANGLFFDDKGNLLACEGGNRQVTSIAPDGTVTVLADKYEGKRFNSPNDLWIDPKGGVYFTDPRYGKMDNLEIDGFHVYYITPARDRVIRVIDDHTKPNGIIGTKDGSTLYVADAGAGRIYSYHIQPDATLTQKKLLIESGSDGMTLDEHGNIYLTQRTVLIFDPQGKSLGSIEFPESPANVTFGGKDRKTLFVTARKGFYSIEMKVKGHY